ncbi:hypothetical protein [Arthrobacter sp. PsM3]|uniref:hypothetical protein n=1 Tax=Arthrobacter sp. PsM3 TaxID=3030531 RepID=UPI00263BDA53|nr:hypothetical protein [Arthrobacter sp. PsM3]MDN4644086.1 hypothetical protein [Arthrobacter sp. PsM3]
MGCSSPPFRRPAGGTRIFTVCGLAAAVVGLALTVSCGAATSGTGTPSAPALATPPAAPAAVPVTAEINQLRDNYSNQIIAIQLTNTTPAPVTVRGAGLASPLFAGTIEWQAAPGGIELPPGQTKMLPAQLRAPECGLQTEPVGEGPALVLRLADGPGTESTAAVRPTDPYGVLSRNNAEMCLSQAASAVAGIRLEPELEVAAGGQGAVLKLTITPRSTPGAVNPGSTGSLTINWIDQTTLLEEDPSAPWPRSVSVSTGGTSQQLRLGIRPARCDPHAVAEDKVGTLLPLRVSVGGRDGILKVDAGALLRGRIHEFITAACGRQ